MGDIVITYEAKIDVTFKEKLELAPFFIEEISKIIISPIGKGGIKFDFYTTFNEIDEALNATQIALRHFEKVFYFKESKKLHSIELKMAVLDGKNIRINDRIFMRDSIRMEVTQDGFHHLKEHLLNSSLYSNDYIDLYLGISKLDDKIAIYVMYYSILTSIFGTQKNVDRYIKNQEPNVLIVPSTKANSNVKETIYSNVRNRIGHTDTNTNIQFVSTNVEKLLPNLTNLVYNAIFNR